MLSKRTGEKHAGGSLALLRDELRALADPQRAQHHTRFFKTGAGQYGAGDRFLGLTAPQVRAAVRRHRDLPLSDAGLLLRSHEHEERLCALLIMVEHYRRGSVQERQAVYDLYLRSTTWINNWDLVDASAEHIVGPHLKEREDRRAILQRLATSILLWDRRIAMLSTFHGIKGGQTEDALYVAELLLHDEHDLIHKAVGWMLREVGKRCDRGLLESFLACHGAEMPRTALRYAIEHFPAVQRARYLDGGPPLPR